MRWDELFADLEAQADSLERNERRGEVDERVRIELARIRLVDRLAPAVGATVRVRCSGSVTAGGVLSRVGSQWLLIDETGGRQALVALSAIMSVSGVGRHTAGAGSIDRIGSRLGLAHAVRAIARDRSLVRIDLIEGTALDGTIDRVGADFFELAVHAAGEPRRRAEVREIALVALSAIAVVRRAT